MDGLHVALGTAVALVTVVTAALWKIVEYVRRMEENQTTYRHELATRLAECVAEAEERVTRRIERLENASIGFRERQGRRPGGNNDD